MYEEHYGTDWTDLDREAILERAFALGLANSLGEHHPGELDRLAAELDTAYERSMANLAFVEGESKGNKHEVAADSPAEEDVWDDLVEEFGVTEVTPIDRSDGLPGAVSRATVLDKPDFDIDAVRLPDFLTR